MASTELLQIIIKADANSAVASFEKLGKAAEVDGAKAEASIERISGKMISMGATTTVAGAVLARGLFAAGKAASDYSEQQSAANVILGEGGAAAAEKFAEAAAKTAGLSKRAALEAVNNFATLGKAGGLSGAGLTKFSTELTQLAGDIAAFKNISTDDAIQKLTSGLAGETEPLRAVGIFLNEDVIKRRAVTMGIAEQGEALTDQQKILARQAEIFAQSSDAQDNFINTSDGLAGSLKRAAAEAENAKAAFGEAAAPAIAQVTQAATGLLASFTEMPKAVQGVAGSVALLTTGAALIGGPLLTAAGSLTQLSAARAAAADASAAANFKAVASASALATAEAELAVATKVANNAQIEAAFTAQYLGGASVQATNSATALAGAMTAEAAAAERLAATLRS